MWQSLNRFDCSFGFFFFFFNIMFSLNRLSKMRSCKCQPWSHTNACHNVHTAPSPLPKFYFCSCFVKLPLSSFGMRLHLACFSFFFKPFPHQQVTGHWLQVTHREAGQPSWFPNKPNSVREAWHTKGVCCWEDIQGLKAVMQPIAGQGSNLIWLW